MLHYDTFYLWVYYDPTVTLSGLDSKDISARVSASRIAFQLTAVDEELFFTSVFMR